MIHDRFAKGALALALGAGALGATAAGVSAVALPTVSGAATSPLLCHKIFGYLTKTVTIAKCGEAQAGAHFVGTDLLSGGTLTWAKSKATTTYTGLAVSPGQGTCTTGHVEYDFTGTVSADTSGYVTVGDGVTYDVCINSTTNVVKLVKGTTGSF